jgi:hypothetical protein
MSGRDPAGGRPRRLWETLPQPRSVTPPLQLDQTNSLIYRIKAKCEKRLFCKWPPCNCIE